MRPSLERAGDRSVHGLFFTHLLELLGRRKLFTDYARLLKYGGGRLYRLGGFVEGVRVIGGRLDAGPGGHGGRGRRLRFFNII